MSENSDIVELSAADYVVFGVLLAVSAAVGIFFAYRDRKKKESKNYLLGDRKIAWWASAISCSLSFLSGATVIGIPSEIMYRGSSYMWFILGVLMANVVGAEVFLPLYYKNGLSSANEYYGVRFGKYARYVATIIYILQTIAYNGVMIYAPAIALSAVSDFSEIAAVLSIGIVCTLYTTLGGLKAVIWTDVIQGLLLTIMLFVVIFGAAGAVGGIGRCLDIAWAGDRMDFNHFEVDPRYRITFWSTVFGLGITWTSITSTNQAVVQRFLCCRSIRDGKMAIYGTIPITLIQTGFCMTFLGYVTYAYFADCDPLAIKTISAADQVLPLMVVRVFAANPGVAGLFIAGVFAGALSTVSSAINGMSSVTVGDIIKPFVNWNEKTLLWVSRGMTLFYGGLCIGFAFLSSVLGSVIQAALSLLGVCAGALLGPVVMGALFPFANEKGAISGMVAALAFNIWLFVGAWIYPPPLRFLNIKDRNIDGCISDSNVTSNISATTIDYSASTSSNSYSSVLELTTSNSSQEERPLIADFYAISFGYYSPLGMMVCIIIGMIVSAATGGLQSRYNVSPDLIYLPFEHPTLRWLPKSFRQYMIPKMGERKEYDAKSSNIDETAETNSIKSISTIEDGDYCKDNQAFEKESVTDLSYL